MSDRFYEASNDELLFGITPNSRGLPEPKLSVTGSQAFIDWIECKDLRRKPTDETPEVPNV